MDADFELYDDSVLEANGQNEGGGDEANTRLQPFLNAARSPDMTTMCTNLAAKCLELQTEKEVVQRAKEQLEEKLQLVAQKHAAELDELRAERDGARAKRDEYLEKCKALEARMLAEESLYYAKNLNGASRLSEKPAKPADADETARSYVNKHGRETIQSYFHTMDESDVEGTVVAAHSEQLEVVQQKGSGTRYVQTVVNFGIIDAEEMMNQTQTAAQNLTVYADRLFEYRTNVVALYDQLKATAKFLAEVVRRVAGEEDEQIQLLLGMVESLQLDIEQNNTIADQLMNDSKHVIEELSALSTTMRTAAEATRNQPQMNSLLMAEFEENQKQLEKLAADKERLTADKKEALKRCNEAIEKSKERDAELENRTKIIVDLQQILEKMNNDREGIKALVKQELTTIYEVMSAVPHSVN